MYCNFRWNLERFQILYTGSVDPQTCECGINLNPICPQPALVTRPCVNVFAEMVTEYLNSTPLENSPGKMSWGK